MSVAVCPSIQLNLLLALLPTFIFVFPFSSSLELFSLSFSLFNATVSWTSERHWDWKRLFTHQRARHLVVVSYRLLLLLIFGICLFEMEDDLRVSTKRRIE